MLGTHFSSLTFRVHFVLPIPCGIGQRLVSFTTSADSQPSPGPTALPTASSPSAQLPALLRQLCLHCRHLTDHRKGWHGGGCNSGAGRCRGRCGAGCKQCRLWGGTDRRRTRARESRAGVVVYVRPAAVCTATLTSFWPPFLTRFPARFIGLSVCGSRSQANDHSERTVRRCARPA